MLLRAFCSVRPSFVWPRGRSPCDRLAIGTACALNLIREIDTPSGIWQSGIFGARLPMMDHLLASPATQFVRANREALPS
jgi:hypothetical protein